MRLDQLLKHFSYESVQGSHDLIITDIWYHSGKVKRGSLFVCIKGQYTDGHDYIMDAVKAGAFAVVVDESCMVNVRWECDWSSDVCSSDLCPLGMFHLHRTWKSARA